MENLHILAQRQRLVNGWIYFFPIDDRGDASDLTLLDLFVWSYVQIEVYHDYLLRRGQVTRQPTPPRQLPILRNNTCFVITYSWY